MNSPDPDKNEISKLLERHSAAPVLQQLVMNWVPETKSVEWCMGFFVACEIHKGIRELFAQERQSEAYLLLLQRIREQLEAHIESESRIH